MKKSYAELGRFFATPPLALAHQIAGENRLLTAALAHQRAEWLFGFCERNWLRTPTVQDFRMILRRMAGGDCCA